MKSFLPWVALAGFLLSFSNPARAQGTAFSYQGRLKSASSPATGLYDLRFTIYDDASAGQAVGESVTNSAVPVTNGLFTVRIDFGPGIFTGLDRWLEIAVRTNGESSFNVLNSRQAILPAPYAITASGISGTLAASQLVGMIASEQIPNLDGSKITNPHFTNEITADDDLRMNDVNIWLRGGNDLNHGLGWYGTGKAFAGVDIDGPVLFGYGGGALGVVRVGSLTNIALQWDSAGTVAVSGMIRGNGAGLTNLPLTGLQITPLTNNQAGVALGGTFTGNGGGLANLNAANLTNAISDLRLSGNIPFLNGTNVFTGTNRFSGVTIVTNVKSQFAGAFVGDGIGLTNLNAASLTNAISDLRLSGNVPFLNGTNVFTGTNRFTGAAILTNSNNQFVGMFAGNGSGLTNLNAASLTNAISDLRLSVNVPFLNGTNVFTGTNRFSGTAIVTNSNNQFAGTFTGNGANLTNVPLSGLQINPVTNNQTGVTLSGALSGNGGGLTNLNASNLTNTISDARLSTNITPLNGTNVFSGTNRFTGVVIATNVNNQFAGAFAGNGAALTNLSAASVSGTLNTTQIPNLDASKITSGTFSGDGGGLTNVSGTLPVQVVLGTNQTAQPNASYLVTNSTPVTIALPASAQVGDIVTVSGAGTGGWTVSAAAPQNIIGATVGPSGVIWVPHVTGFWNAAASSSDGAKLVAAMYGGQIYTSTDSGATWTARDSSRYWMSAASSSDGTKLVAVDGGYVNSGHIHTSTDSGVTWTQRESARPWIAVASSANGTKLVAAANDEIGGYGQIYTSTDSGLSWTARDSARGWRAVASSADGTKLVAVKADFDGGEIYTSTDSGSTWNPRGMDQTWACVASSADGVKLVAGGDTGKIYTSTDSGATWTARESVRRWRSVASSSDGTKLIAAAWTDRIYISADSGASWVARDSSRRWQVVSSSADGAKLIAGTLSLTSTDFIYTSAPQTFLTGGAGAATTMQYVGSGQWQPLADPRLLGTTSVLLTNVNNQLAGSFSGNGAGLTNIPGLLPVQVVAGTSQAAQPNTSYLLTSSSRTTVTLPVAPDVGDIVTVSGSGAGGWTVAPASQQGIVGNPAAGLIWTPRESIRDWQAIACSATGTRCVAIEYGGKIYTSSNSGSTWTARESARNWKSVASSSNGTKLVAVVSGGQIYTSTDSGSTWTARDSNRNWQSVASSSDGTKLVAVVNLGQIYTSTDSGVSWTARDSNRNWLSVASSSDGVKLVAVVGGGQDYTSTDSGVTWAGHSTSRNWYAIASSADGTKLVGVEGSDGAAGPIVTSTDSGVSWTLVNIANQWSAVASSSDGTQLIATAVSAQIYTSSDSGATWTARDFNRNWVGAASSSDGTSLFAVVSSGQIYTSASAVFDGSAGTTATLQYTGNGQWQPLVDSQAASLDESGLRLNDKNIWFRSGSDVNHGLGWYGSSKPFAGLNIDGPVLFGYGGGALGIFQSGVQTTALKWDSSQNLRAPGLLRMGSETNTSEAPSPAGVVVRRINSTDSTYGSVIARTDFLTLERDGTDTGLNIRYDETSGRTTISCMGINKNGSAVNFYRALNPGSSGTIQPYSDSQHMVHVDITFGRTFDKGRHITHVILDRYDDGSVSDNYWAGFLTSTYNQ